MAAARPAIIISDAQAFGDDGAALALLFASRKFSPVTLVASSGNVWADEAYANLKNLVARFGLRDVAILKGLSPEKNRARLNYFETNHRSDVRFAGALRMPAPKSDPAGDEAAIKNLIAAIEAANKPDIILLAPATILSAALALRPDLSIGRVFAMGGAVHVPGNATPQAEFNVWFDPESADALFASNVALTLLPLDATNGLTFPRELIAKLDPASPYAAYIHDYLEKWKGTARPLWDEALVAAVLSPALIRRAADMRLGVVREHNADFGACRIEPSARPVQIILELDRGGLNALLVELLAGPQ